MRNPQTIIIQLCIPPTLWSILASLIFVIIVVFVAWNFGVLTLTALIVSFSATADIFLVEKATFKHQTAAPKRPINK